MDHSAPNRFTYRVTDGWLRDLAAEPTPVDTWPSIGWDEQVLQDQFRFLDAQVDVGVDLNVVWGLFASWSWPVELTRTSTPARVDRLERFVNAAHDRGIKILSGVGVYSWGFGEIIAQHPEVASASPKAMCLSKPAAWDWQRRIFDFLMDPRWKLDGVSMQSADLGRCECAQCSKLTQAEYHAAVLTRSAQYIRTSRPEWVIGQASWGLNVNKAEELAFVQEISRAVDYMVEVNEVPGLASRPDRIRELSCAYGTVGGVFVEPPQHWDRLRWFVPCGLGSARSLRRLWEDGGRACEYFYRPFANPVEEVSWRTGARILSTPDLSPENSLRQSVAEVYGVSGVTLNDLTDWFTRGEEAYFGRSNFQVGMGSLSLEPLIWEQNPAAPGPAVYLSERLSGAARAAYTRDLLSLAGELEQIPIGIKTLKTKTLTAIRGTLADLSALDPS